MASINDLQDKPNEIKEESWDKVGTGAVGDSIETIRDLKTLSLMFGLEDGFNENMDKAKYLYEWSKKVGEKPLDVMKSIMSKTGYQETGKLLFKKVYQWVRLQENIDSLKNEQDLLS